MQFFKMGADHKQAQPLALEAAPAAKTDEGFEKF
jgi:hypothetical protein